MILVVARSSSTFCFLDRLFVQQAIQASSTPHIGQRNLTFLYTLIKHDLSMIWFVPYRISGWLSTEQEKGVRRQEGRASRAIPSHFSAWLTCHWHLGGEGEQAPWLWGWVDFCLHGLGVTYTNMNLSNILAYSRLSLTLHTHTQLLWSQFAPVWRKVLTMNHLLSPPFTGVSL